MPQAVGMLITSSILKRRGVCQLWRKRFRKKFPKGRVRVTQRNCEDRAQSFPWTQCAQRLLTGAGYLEYQKHESIITHHEHQLNAWSKENPISRRARNVALASVFGFLAQQKRFDPAHAL